ncbi:hypothetical protein [Streptomyces sp. NRRL S-350]|uniref:hypothetical protein n=1 Tax=Streptomyces sp. NRRL S-350 TaxID=1463902 RepID=UPI0004C07EB1|nr:hypothetical protein [Streptomyces sp. NRRL S-350]
MTVPDIWPEPGRFDHHLLIMPTVLRDSHPGVDPVRLANSAARKQLFEPRDAGSTPSGISELSI